MAQVHDSKTGGHLGLNKTYLKLRERYWWLNMYKDLKEWIKSCPDCGGRKNPQQNIMPKAKIVVSKAWDCVGVDVLGPFPKSDRGNVYVIIFIDYLTRWVEAFAIPNQTAITCATKLVEEIIRNKLAREVDLQEPKVLHAAMTIAQKVETILDNHRHYWRPSHASNASTTTSTYTSIPS